MTTQNAQWIFETLEPFMRRMSPGDVHDALRELVERGRLCVCQYRDVLALWSEDREHVPAVPFTSNEQRVRPKAASSNEAPHG